VNQLITNAIKKAFEILDERFHEEYHHQSQRCGAAIVLVLIVGNRLFCANLGDSRAVLCRNGKAINLSLDQKATRPDEIKRVTECGGQIQMGRVMARLAITRAFGDFEYKVFSDDDGGEIRKYFLSNQPEVRMLEIDPFIDDFFILASDGLFDKMTS